MTQDEAVKEAARHTGLYNTIARRGVKAGLISNDEVDDAVQEMYIRACKAFLTYEPSKGAVGTYLRLPCHTVIRTMARERKKWRHADLRCSMAAVFDGVDEEMPESHREALAEAATMPYSSRVLRGMSVPEIAADRGFTFLSTRNGIARERRQLKTKYGALVA